jgi:hypothetical protein
MNRIDNGIMQQFICENNASMNNNKLVGISHLERVEQ